MAKTIGDITRIRRPRAPETGQPVLVRLQKELSEPLDKWRLKQADKPSRPEAIRRLVELGLKAKVR
jgi:metal-responsive CopG/Arc/MetJ family transcriptional regulator